MDEATSEKPLATMTVKELRDLAKELPGVTGIHAMKKEELLTLLAKGEAPAAEAPAAKAAPKAKGAAKKGGKKVKEMNRAEIKGRLKELRHDREELGATDKRKAAILRRRINRLKKRCRSAVAA